MEKRQIPVQSALSRRAMVLLAFAMTLVLILACAPQPADIDPIAQDEPAGAVEPTLPDEPVAEVEPTATDEPAVEEQPTAAAEPTVAVETTATEEPAAEVAPTVAEEPAEEEEGSTIVFTLVTVAGGGGYYYEGQGGAIDGIVNPTLEVAVGDVVEVILINGDGGHHDIVSPDLGLRSSMLNSRGSETSIVWEATEAGEFAYWCSVPGHRAAGMEGLIVISD